MKKIIAAIAFAIALPAAGQTAQTQPAPAQHQGHAGMDHGAHAQHQRGQAQHEDHAMRAGCCADRDGNGRKGCCEGEGDQRNCCQKHPRQQRAQPKSDQNN